MTPALMLAYYFPPIGGGGVQRSLKFCRYLPDFGYHPVVLTTAETEARADPILGTDDSATRALPAGGVLVRSAPSDPSGIRCRLARLHLLGLARFFFYPWFWERQALWYRPALVAARQAIRDHTPRVLYSTCSPYTAARVGARLKQETGLPWVLDLRDAYTLADWSWPSRLHHRLCQRIERACFQRADAVILNTEAMRDLYCTTYPDLDPQRFTVITNGFDPGDFPESPPPTKRDHFHIAHIGALHHLGTEAASAAWSSRLNPLRWLEYGGPSAYDGRPRSAYFLFRGLAHLFRQRPELRGRVRLDFYGPVAQTHAFDAMAEAMELDACVVRHGTVPRPAALQAMQAADLLFLPSERRLDGRKSIHTPGKLFEYLACRRPILVVAGPGNAADIALRSGLGDFHQPDDAEGIAHTLGRHIDRWLAGGPPPAADEAYLQRFERRALTGQLATIFDALCGKDSSHA